MGLTGGLSLSIETQSLEMRVSMLAALKLAFETGSTWRLSLNLKAPYFALTTSDLCTLSGPSV
jgi:hypothetical protein